MAEKLYKVGEPITLGYQAPNKESGLTIVAEIFLPNKQKDSNFPDIILPEVGSTGTYRDDTSFVPDQQGTWQANIHKDDGDGQVVKSFSVGGHNVHSVGEAVVAVDSAVGAVDGKVNTVDGKVTTVDGKVTTVDGKVVAVDGKVDNIQTKCATIETKIDAIDAKVGALDTPPMAF